MGTKFSLDTVVERRRIVGHSLTVDLAFPPSTNNLFVNAKHGGRFKSDQYKAWETDAGWALVADRAGRVPGPVLIALIYEDKPGRRDLDNLIKPVCDLLVKHRVIDGDHRSIVRKITAEWNAEVKGVRVTITSILTREAKAA